MNKTLRNMTKTRSILKVMCFTIIAVVILMSMTLTAFADGANNTSEGVKAIYTYIVDIAKVAGALLAIFGIIQIGISLGSTHDATQRMTGILLAAGGALIFFADDIIGLMGITV